MTRVLAAAVFALLVFAPVAAGSTGAPYDARGRLVYDIPFTPKGPVKTLTEAKAVRRSSRSRKSRRGSAVIRRRAWSRRGRTRRRTRLGREGLVGPGG